MTPQSTSMSQHRQQLEPEILWLETRDSAMTTTMMMIDWMAQRFVFSFRRCHFFVAAAAVALTFVVASLVLPTHCCCSFCLRCCCSRCRFYGSPPTMLSVVQCQAASSAWISTRSYRREKMLFVGGCHWFKWIRRLLMHSSEARITL